MALLHRFQSELAQSEATGRISPLLAAIAPMGFLFDRVFGRIAPVLVQQEQ